MLRYRIARDPSGEYFVLSASLLSVPYGETYATRRAAQDTADWLNGLEAAAGRTGGGKSAFFRSSSAA